MNTVDRVVPSASKKSSRILDACANVSPDTLQDKGHEYRSGRESCQGKTASPGPHNFLEPRRLRRLEFLLVALHFLNIPPLRKRKPGTMKRISAWAATALFCLAVIALPIGRFFIIPPIGFAIFKCEFFIAT